MVASCTPKSPVATWVMIWSAYGTRVSLSKAIPALSQWREGLVKSAEAAAQTAKKLHDAHESFQIAKSLNLGQSITAPMERAALDSLANVQTALTNALPKTSKIVKKAFSEGFTITDQDISNYKSQATRMSNIQTAMENARSSMGDTDKVKSDALDKEILSHKKRTEEMHRAVSEAQTELALRKQINIELDKVHSAVAKDPAYLSMEAALKRKSDSAAQTSARANILSQVGANTQSMGMGEAWSKLKQDIDNSEVSLTKTNKAITLLKGGATIATSAVMTLASSLGNLFMVVGIAVAIFEVFNGINSKNSKQIAELNSSLESLNNTITGMSNTLDVINSKDMMGRMSVDSTKARAVALQELADAAKSTVKALLSTDAAASEWDRFWDYIKSSVGKDIRSQTTKTLSSAIEEAMKGATSGPAKDKAKLALQNLLSIKDLKASSIEEAFNKLDTEGVKSKFKAVTETLSKFSTQTSNSASILVSFKDTMQETEKQLQTLMNAYIPSDNASKFAIAQVQQAFALGKALEDPIEGMKALAEVTNKADNLKLFPPEVVALLQSASKEINNLVQDFGILDKRISESRDKVLKYKEALSKPIEINFDLLTKHPIENMLNLFNNIKDKMDAKSKLPEENANLARLEAIETVKKNRAIEIANKTSEIADKSYKAGADVLARSLTQASEQAGINFSKAVSSIMKGTGSAKLDADIARQEVSMQEKMLQSDAELIRSQKELTLTIEQGNLLTKLASEKTTEEEKKTIASSLATNSKSLDFVKAKHSEGTLTALNNEQDPKVRQELFNYATAMVGVDQKRISLAGQYNVIAINERIAGIRSTISEEQKWLSERSKGISLEQESNNNILASVGIYSEELQSRKEVLAVQLESLKISEMQLKIAGLREEQNAIANSSASKDVKSAMNKTYNDAISHANIDLANEEQALAQKTFKLKYDNQVLLYNEQVRLDTQALKADKASVDLKMDATNIEINKLDTINSIYTINQELYNEQKAQLELSKVKMQLDIDLAQVEFDKKVALGKLALDNIAAEEAAWQEFNRNQDSTLLASNMAAIDRARALRQAQIEQDSNIGTSAANSKAGVSSAAIENTRLLNEETRKTNELLAAQASLVESLTAVFGDLGSAIGSAADGFFKMGNAQDKLDKGFKDDISKKVKGTEEYNKTVTKYQNESLKNELSGYAAMAGGLKKMFNEKTAAYKILDGIEKGAHILKMAQQVAELLGFQGLTIAKIFGIQAVTTAQVSSVGPEVSASMAKANASALGAVANQGNGDPYSAFFRIAAMIAIMAGLGLMVGGGGGGSIPSIPEEVTAEYIQKNQGTGTVLGDSTAHSESIAKGIEILSEHSFEMLDYTQGMLTALKSMDKGITNLADSLAIIGGITGIGGLSAFGTVEKSTVDPGFFNDHTSNVNITDTGIIIQGTVDALIALTGTIKQYEVVVETWSDSGFLGFGADSGTNITNNIKDLKSSSAIKEIGLIFSGMKDSIREGMKLLSFDPTEITDILGSVGKIDFVGDELRASLKGLSGEDIKNALNGVFSAAFDKMADFAVPWAKNFQKVGEGVGETFIRLASDARTLNMSLEAAGMGMDSFNTQFSNFNDKSDKTIFADPVKIAQRNAAQNAVDAAEAALAELKNKSSAARGIYMNPDIAINIPELAEITAAEKTLTEANQDLAIASIGASDSIMTYNEALVKAQQYLLDGAGGAEAFNSKMQFFTESFLTDSQRLAPITARVKAAFADMTPKSSEIGSIAGLGAQLKSMNMQVPTTRTEFASLMATLSDPENKLGITTEAGADLYNTLLTLAPAFDAVTSALEDIANTVADIASRGEEMKRSFTMDTLDTAGKYAYLQREDTTTRATMLAKDDKGEYVQTFTQSAVSANRLLDTINEAWGLMDETQKKANLGAYTQKVDEVMTFMKARGIEEMAGMSPDGINTVEAINKSADLIATAIGNLDANYDKTKDTTLAEATKNITQDNIDTIISQTFAAFSSMNPENTATYTDPLSAVADKLPEMTKILSDYYLSDLDSTATKMGAELSSSISSAIATNPQISAILANPTDAGVAAAGMTTAQLPTAMSGVLDSLKGTSSATLTSIDQMISMFNGLETTLANTPQSPEVEAFKQDLENNKQALMDQKSSIEAQQAAATAAVAELAAGTGSLSSVAGALQGLIASLAAVAKEPANVNVSVSVSAPVGSEVGSSVT